MNTPGENCRTASSHNSWRRPDSVAEVAESSSNYGDFGLHLKDFLHTVHFTKKESRSLSPLFVIEPIRLASRFSEGELCDAILAAVADYFCRESHLPTPEWAQNENRILKEPWFSVPYLSLRGM